MTSTLNPAYADRLSHPYALMIEQPDGGEPVVLHFDCMGSATLYALLVAIPMGDPSRGETNVRKFVARLDPSILHSSRLGWIETDTFDPTLCHEVREVEKVRELERLVNG